MNELSLFPLGRVLATPGTLEMLNPIEIHQLLLRHRTGDWGDLCDDDRAANERALTNGGRIFSAYQLDVERRVWIITEADRSATTLLLPSEY